MHEAPQGEVRVGQSVLPQLLQCFFREPGRRDATAVAIVWLMPHGEVQHILQTCGEVQVGNAPTHHRREEPRAGGGGLREEERVLNEGAVAGGREDHVRALHVVVERILHEEDVDVGIQDTEPSQQQATCHLVTEQVEFIAPSTQHPGETTVTHHRGTCAAEKCLSLAVCGNHNGQGPHQSLGSCQQVVEDLVPTEVCHHQVCCRVPFPTCPLSDLGLPSIYLSDALDLPPTTRRPQH
mmetsp:Transcript_167114/g.536725  ORF Transcript_167114/g.536725 Transcript_167114/m.536725 type:complete len:238 (-) Transcript_167114:396-1109(-)